MCLTINNVMQSMAQIFERSAVRRFSDTKQTKDMALSEYAYDCILDSDSWTDDMLSDLIVHPDFRNAVIKLITEESTDTIADIMALQRIARREMNEFASKNYEYFADKYHEQVDWEKDND